MPGCGGRSGAGPSVAQATHGFSGRAQEPGTPLRTPPGSGAGTALGWHRQRLPGAGREGQCSSRTSCTAPPVTHAHSTSAIGLGQLCPPEIITSFLLLLLLLLLSQSPSPPLPRGGPRGISPHSAQLCILGAPELRLHSWSHRPHLQCLLLLLLVLPFGLGLARGGGGEVGVPGPRVWLLVQLEGAVLLPAIISPASEPRVLLCPILCSPGLGALPPPCTITSVPHLWLVPSRVLASCWGPECLLWGGSWLTLPSPRAQGSGCGAALPSPPLPLG